MPVIMQKLIPFKGFRAMFLFGFLFAKSLGRYTVKHESIHRDQWLEMMLLFSPIIFINWWLALALPCMFYVWYGIEWFIRRVFLKDKHAYKNLFFEKDAYTWQAMPNKRKPYHWVKLIFRK